MGRGPTRSVSRAILVSLQHRPLVVAPLAVTIHSCADRAATLHKQVVGRQILIPVVHVDRGKGRGFAARIATIKGVEANARQFCPEASAREARVHPGIFRANRGELDLRSIAGDGLGYR